MSLVAPLGIPSDPRANLGPGSPVPATSQSGMPTGTSQADPSLPATAQVPAAGELQAAVDSLNRAVKAASHNILFSIDPDTKRVLVRIVDADTDDIIRQIPSEEVLELARTLEQGQGLILNGQA